jgi:hypothetical protein
MKTILTSLLAGTMLCAAVTHVHAWQPGGADLDTAIKSGEFNAYLTNASAWLNEKAPAKPDEKTAATLLKDPVFLSVLDQRQLIAKTGADKLGAFAKADPANQAFLTWLLKNTPAMELYLEGAVPIGLAAREANDYTLNTSSLETWKKILKADPDAKDGLYLKMAIALALASPTPGGAGSAEKSDDAISRYQHYKTAHQKMELMPSFDKLTVWEYTKVLTSGASEADLTWAREMVNTFRPDLRIDERVVETTSLVWRRAAPPKFYPNGGYQNFKNVLSGGGKCGPRSSWSVMICRAFGIPAIGVGQPAHACVAYKSANPMLQPQPGSAWKVGFGGGWQVSKLEGMSGPEFLAAIEKRSDAAKFSAVEHLRWLASALSTADRSAAFMEVSRKINDSITAAKTDLTASLKPDEAEADPGVKAAALVKTAQPAVKTTLTNNAPTIIKAAAGTLLVDAASFTETGGKTSWGGQTPHVLVHDSYSGGKQIYFQQQMKEQWADYTLDVPTAGNYQITMKATCINDDQLLEVCSGSNVIATVPIANTFGLWEETKPVELKLEQGKQTLRVQTPASVNAENHKRGIALKSFELKPKAN